MKRADLAALLVDEARRHGTRSGLWALRRLEKSFHRRRATDRAQLNALHPDGLVEEGFGGGSRSAGFRQTVRAGGGYRTVGLAHASYCPRDQKI